MPAAVYIDGVLMDAVATSNDNTKTRLLRHGAV